MDPSAHAKSLRDLCWHLANFHALVAQRSNQLCQGSVPWTPELHRSATLDILEAFRDRFYPILVALGGAVTIPSTGNREGFGDPPGYDEPPLFRWFEPQRTVELLDSWSFEPESPGGTLLAKCLCIPSCLKLKAIEESVFEEPEKVVASSNWS